MNYTAHLSTGGTVELSVEDRFTPLRVTAGSSGWIMDDNGAMINMKFCAALVPVIEPALSDLPDLIVDGDGDEWIREGQVYRTPVFALRRTLEQVREIYGLADDQP